MVSAWLPVAAYAALIFTLSSMPALAPPADVSHLDKVLHAVEYGVLGGILARAWGRTLPHAGWRWWFLPALLMGAAIGAGDEWFQGTVGRQQSLGDWLTDVAAVAAAAGIAAQDRLRARSPYWMWKQNARERTEPT